MTVEHSGTATSYPLSFEQQGYLGLQRRGYGAIPACCRVTGPLDMAALTAAAQCVVDRHEPLRMRIEHGDDGPRQRFLPPGAITVRWSRVPLQGATPLHRLEECLRADLDPLTDGVVRLQIMDGEEGSTYLLAMLDHLACDAWSTHIFLRELWAVYQRLVHGEGSALPPLALSYSGHILAQQQRANRDGAERIRRYWEEKAQHFASAATGPSVMGPAAAGGGRADLASVISAETVANAAAFATACGVSVNTVPLVCVVLALHAMTGSDSVGLSFIYSGRDRRTTRSTIGVFHRHVGLYVDGVTGKSLGRLAGDVGAAVMESLRHSQPPYAARDFSAAVRRQRPQPTADILFNQVPTTFGSPRSARPISFDDTRVEFIAAHFWPHRWRDYAEPRLRLVAGGGEEPTVRTIFNEGAVAEKEVRGLLECFAGLFASVHTSQADSPATSLLTP
jgi:Condensation domain